GLAEREAAWYTWQKVFRRTSIPCEGPTMGNKRHYWWPLLALALSGFAPPSAEAACCYFSAQNADILQPAQKVFISWDPVKQVESFTVQPKFEGNALDFGMVIPTPTQPKLHEMPRDFFKHLAVFSILKKRESPHSKLLYLGQARILRERARLGAVPADESDK